MEDYKYLLDLKDIVLSVGFLKIVIPAAIGILVWYLNEKSKRSSDEYKRKEESYKELIRTLEGFTVDGHDHKLKQEFLYQLNILWLYAPDPVIKKVYKFLSRVHVQNTPTFTDESAELLVGELILEIRKDLLSRKMVKNTKLKREDFLILRSTGS